MSYRLPKDYRAVNLRRQLYEMKPSHANAKFRSAQSRTLICAGIGTPLRFVGWDAERAISTAMQVNSTSEEILLTKIKGSPELTHGVFEPLLRRDRKTDLASYGVAEMKDSQTRVRIRKIRDVECGEIRRSGR